MKTHQPAALPPDSMPAWVCPICCQQRHAGMLQSPERRIYPTFFSDRASDFTPDLSERVTAALKEVRGRVGWGRVG